MSELDGIHAGVLGKSSEVLVLEHHDLEARRGALLLELQDAEAALAAAQKQDTADNAAAIRAGKKAPGRLATGVAEAALQDAQAAMGDIKEAVLTCEQDLVATWADRKAEIRRDFDEAEREASAEWMLKAEEMCKRAERLHYRRHLLRYIEDPIDANGKLRRFSVPPLRVKIPRTSHDGHTSVGLLIESMAKVFEQGNIDAQLLRAADEAGLAVDRIFRCESVLHAFKAGNTVVTDMRPHGLARFAFEKGKRTAAGPAVQVLLIVAESTLESQSLREVFAMHREQIDRALADNARIVEPVDPATLAVIDACASGTHTTISRARGRHQKQSRRLVVSMMPEVRAARESNSDNDNDNTSGEVSPDETTAAAV